MESSVLPTPVGPANRKLPIGRSAREIPALPRFIADETARTAFFCPTTARFRSSSSVSSLSASLFDISFRGMPVRVLAASAISFSVTVTVPPVSGRRLSYSADRVFSLSRISAASSKSCFMTAASFSAERLSSRRLRLPPALSELRVGSFAAAQLSSIRSIALSGSLRSSIYRTDSLTAASIAPSVRVTPWCSSYLGRSPRSISAVSSAEGSSTYIALKRLARAGSLSI